MDSELAAFLDTHDVDFADIIVWANGATRVRARSNRMQDLLPFVPDMLKVEKDTKPGRSTRLGRIVRR